MRRARLLALDMPSFALQVVRRYLEQPAVGATVVPKWRGFSQKELLQELLIDYRGPPKTIQTVSYYQALDPQQLLPPGIFADKIVLVGWSLEAIPEPQRLSGDTFLTPFSWMVGSPSAGVEIQATLVDNLLNGRFVAELTPGRTLAGTAGAGAGRQPAGDPTQATGRPYRNPRAGGAVPRHCLGGVRGGEPVATGFIGDHDPGLWSTAAICCCGR